MQQKASQLFKKLEVHVKEEVSPSIKVSNNSMLKMSLNLRNF